MTVHLFQRVNCSPSGSLFSSRVSLTNHPVVPKLGDKEFCVNVDTQPASSPVWSSLSSAHFVCIRHGVTYMARSFERWERTTSPLRESSAQ